MDNSSNYTTTPHRKDIIEALWRLQKIILDTLDFNQVTQSVCDGLLSELGYLQLGYRIIVLTLINNERNTLQRISLSSTPEAAKAQEVSAVPFHNIEIPLSAKDNLLIKSLTDKKPYSTKSWPDIFRPILTDEQAFTNQQAAGIKTSMVYPVVVNDKPMGVLIFSIVKEEKEVSEEEKELIRGFTDIVGLAVQNSILYSSLEKTSKQLKDANERLKELDKLKDEFVSLASHELRTPMTVIKSYVWMLLQNKAGEINEKQKTYLDRTYSSTERLINLVNDMLNISRIESGRLVVNMKEFDMVKLTTDVIVEMQTRALELGVNLLYTPPQSGFLVKADDERIKQVIINLLGNSFKFTPKGGNITVSLSSDGSFIRLSVTDNGKGISAEDIPKLFQKFNMVGTNYLTKLNTQGTGLGLYLSKSLIEMHGGKIWAESQGEGRGSTFSFTLPVLGSQLAQPKGTESVGEQQSGQDSGLAQEPAKQIEQQGQSVPVKPVENLKPELQNSANQQDSSLPH